MGILSTILISICLNLDIMIVCDYSGSVSGNQSYISESVGDFSTRFDSNVRVGVIVFNTKAYIFSNLESNSIDVEDLKYIPADGSTKMSNAVSLSKILLLVDRSEAKKFMIIITDGSVDNETNTRKSILLAKQEGISIIGIKIRGEEDYGFLKSISDIYLETSYEMLIQELDRLSFCM